MHALNEHINRIKLTINVCSYFSTNTLNLPINITLKEINQVISILIPNSGGTNVIYPIKTVILTMIITNITIKNSVPTHNPTLISRTHEISVQSYSIPTQYPTYLSTQYVKPIYITNSYYT